MNWNCRICNVEFVRDEVCVTCGAEKLYDATIKDLQEDVEHYKKDARYANGVAELAMRQRNEAEAKVDDLEAEILRLRAKCDMQANILRKLTPEKFPDTLFISGVLGERDSNNMPQKLLVVPAYGVDFSYIYERTEKTTGPEW
jgi:hypothetical protein